MQKYDTIQRISDDFENRKGPFSDVTFPEEELLEEAAPFPAQRANMLFAFCTLDYNRDARQLKDNLVELYEDDPVWFAPKTLTNDTTSYTLDDLNDIMSDIGFRYKNRDSQGLWKNYNILSENYGNVRNLLASVDYKAPALVKQLREDDFSYIKGKKLAPFFARVLHDEVSVRKLDQIWSVDIPVDTHIRTLTQKITGEEMSDDEIRRFWQVCGDEKDIERHVVDGALWHIGNQWDNWGEDYFEKVS